MQEGIPRIQAHGVRFGNQNFASTSHSFPTLDHVQTADVAFPGFAELSGDGSNPRFAKCVRPASSEEFTVMQSSVPDISVVRDERIKKLQHACFQLVPGASKLLGTEKIHLAVHHDLDSSPNEGAWMVSSILLSDEKGNSNTVNCNQCLQAHMCLYGYVRLTVLQSCK